MKKNNIFTIVLIIIVLGLGSFIVYQNYFKTNKCKAPSNETPKIESNLLDTTKVSQYKNYDGTYGDQKIIESQDYITGNNHHYYSKLSLDGKLKICVDSMFNNCINIENVNNIIDIVEFSSTGSLSTIFILTDNSNVYKYNLELVDSNTKTATLVEEASNVKKIINYNYGPKENAGGVWGVMAITENNEYISLAQESV